MVEKNRAKTFFFLMSILSTYNNLVKLKNISYLIN